MRVSQTKGGKTYHYRGSLKKEHAKCVKELDKLNNSDDLSHWEFILKQAEKNVNRIKNRKRDLERFIYLCENDWKDEFDNEN